MVGQQNWWDNKTGGTTKLVGQQKWWDNKTGGTTKVVGQQKWWDKRKCVGIMRSECERIN